MAKKFDINTGKTELPSRVVQIELPPDWTAGKDGKDGADGKDGIDGKDGANGKDGLDGVDGKDGKDGVDGVGIQSITQPLANRAEVKLTDGESYFLNLPKGENGKQVELQTSTTHIQWRYEGESWIDLAPIPKSTFSASGGGGTRKVKDLRDVVITDVSDGQTIVWSASASAWVNGAASAGLAIGNTITSATAGSVLFAGEAGVLAQDNARLFWNNTNKNLGIGTASPNASCVLDLVSTTQGFGTPSMTTAQRNAISSPRRGTLVWASDADILSVFGALSTWQTICTQYTAASFFSPAQIVFPEATSNGGQKITLVAPTSLAADATCTLNANTGTMMVSNGKQVYDATNTATGATGAQTINKPSGAVNFAAGATSLVVTNSLCTTASLVFCEVRTNDATATIKNVVPAAGSFTINLNAAATAETSVGFFIIN